MNARHAVLIVCWTTAAAILGVGLFLGDPTFAALAVAVFSGSIPLLVERPRPRQCPARASTQS